MMSRDVHDPVKAHQDPVKYFNEWVSDGKYERDVGGVNYTGPSICADALSRHLKGADTARILDIGAGTGLLGAELRKRGFTNIDAIDPTDSMLAVARERGIYRNYYVEFVSSTPTTLREDSYDAIGCTGAMSYIPCAGLDEMRRLVKPGGVVVLAMAEKFLQVPDSLEERLDHKLTAMEEGGLWRTLEKTQLPNHYFEHSGLLLVFQVIKPAMSAVMAE